MYEIETVTGYPEATLAQDILNQMVLNPAETWVVGAQSFIAGLTEKPEGVLMHSDIIDHGANVVVTGDARCWVDTGVGVLCFRSGFFADEVKASFGIMPPTHQPAAAAPQPSVEAPASVQQPVAPPEPLSPPTEPPGPTTTPEAPVAPTEPASTPATEEPFQPEEPEDEGDDLFADEPQPEGLVFVPSEQVNQPTEAPLSGE